MNYKSLYFKFQAHCERIMKKRTYINLTLLKTWRPTSVRCRRWFCTVLFHKQTVSLHTSSGLCLWRPWKSLFTDIYSSHRQMVSASQDGKLLIWDTFTGNKVKAKKYDLMWIRSLQKYINDIKYNTSDLIFKPDLWNSQESYITYSLCYLFGTF